MVRIFACFVVLIGLGFALACGGSASGSGASGSDSPTEAYKRLYAAVKKKDTEAIKATMTKNTHAFAEMAASKSSKPIEKVFENGFTATTFAETLPEIRDERINENFGAVEVYNSRDKIWEDLPFMLEDGQWKLAIGEAFGGTYKSPGKGRDFREKEAANAANASLQPAASVVPMNANIIVPKPATNASNAAADKKK
jgi:hypothetical protein